MQNVFKRNILAVPPADAVTVHKKGQRFARYNAGGRTFQRELVTTSKGDRVVIGQSRKWYGKVKLGTKTWKTVQLYTDRTASERRLQDLQRDADLCDSGVKRPDLELLRLPIADLRDRYIESLRQQRRKDAHVKITGFML